MNREYATEAEQSARAVLSIVEARSFHRDSGRGIRNGNLQPISLHLGVHRGSRHRLRVLKGHSPLRPCSISLSNSQSCARRQQRVLQTEIVILALVVLVAFAETIIARLTADLVREVIAACRRRCSINVAPKVERDAGAHVWRGWDRRWTVDVQ